MAALAWPLAAVVVTALAVWVVAGPKAPPGVEAPAKAGTSRALILAGLPGDAEHEEQFATVAGQWRTWLTETLGFPPDEVRVLFGKNGKEGLAKGPATGPAVTKEIADLKRVLQPEDRLWVFFLGHGNYDGEQAYFHLSGRDLSAPQLGALFKGLPCREQVFWMTTSASGWFLKSLSAKGRIVITATLADDEYNDTEFPQALATVSKRPLAEGDGKVSMLDLYRLTVAEVNARFAADERLPTEHAQLDDNGDGVGTEEPMVEGNPEGKKPTGDGALAAKTFLPTKH
jgi:hypothetical protein